MNGEGWLGDAFAFLGSMTGAGLDPLLWVGAGVIGWRIVSLRWALIAAVGFALAYSAVLNALGVAAIPSSLLGLMTAASLGRLVDTVLLAALFNWLGRRRRRKGLPEVFD